MASSTAFPRSNGRVWRVAGVVAVLRAGADVKAMTEATGRRGALARPWTRPCTLWRVCASRARCVPANGLLSLVDQDVQGVQEGERKVDDMVVHGRKAWRGELARG